MAFDGGFLHKVINELNEATDCHIDKINQPSKEELVFSLRKKGFNKKLLITIKGNHSRLHFTERKYENPLTPPNFCMLLRKYLSSAKLIEITQPSLERLVELHFSATNELGDIVKLKLICELMGSVSNVILTNSENIIIDALRRSDVENAKRLILPGAVYTYPENSGKLNPLSVDTKTLAHEILKCDFKISDSILRVVDGFSPLICRETEIYYDEFLENSNSEDALEKALNLTISHLKNNIGGYILYKKDNSLFDFSYLPIKQYGGDLKLEKFDSPSLLLDNYFYDLDTTSTIKNAGKDIIKLVTNLKLRTEKKYALRLLDLKKCEKRETLRIYGELIKANLHLIRQGDEYAIVTNYYDENLSEIKIPLNPALSPSKCAEKYFKDYKKTYTAEQTLTKLIENDIREIEYFDSVLDSISRTKTLAELSQIREELISGGYIRKNPARKPQKIDSNSIKSFTSKEGFKILVGKNNIQNDYITTKLASKNDMWFHVKNFPGSHVVILSGTNEISDETLLFAATLAATNSKASDSAQIPVDYTMIKYVKKPSGAKPGMVIYTTNKTIYVTPKRDEII